MNIFKKYQQCKAAKKRKEYEKMIETAKFIHSNFSKKEALLLLMTMNNSTMLMAYLLVSKEKRRK